MQDQHRRTHLDLTQQLKAGTHPRQLQHINLDQALIAQQLIQQILILGQRHHQLQPRLKTP